MAKIENTTEGDRVMTVNFGDGKSVTVTIPKRSGEPGSITNGVADVDDEVLAKAMGDVVVKAWFDSGDLLVRAKPAAHRSTETEDAGKGHAHKR